MTTARDHYLHPIASIRPPAVDGSGNVYVAGTIGAYGYVGAATFGGSSYTLTPTGLEDGWVWMLNSSGTTEWVAQADGSGATVVLQGVNITSSGLISTGGYFDGTQYDAQGNPYLVTSYNGSGWVVNQVEDLYNGFGQLVQEFQAVSGAVTSSTPYVEYNYTDAADGNNSRLTSIEYPDGYMCRAKLWSHS